MAKICGPKGNSGSAAAMVALLLCGLAVVGILLYPYVVLSDRWGTYYNLASPADLNGDGLLDVVLHNMRKEPGGPMWGATTLWFNQGEGRFAPQALPELPPLLYTTAMPGDADGDGDADLLLLHQEGIMLLLNQGGAQGGEPGSLKLNNSSYAPGNAWLAELSRLAPADLNGDGKLDAFITGCCGYPGDTEGAVAAPSLAGAWLNDSTDRDGFKGHALGIAALDGIPLRAAALGDLDGDGDLDAFAVSQNKEGSLSVGAEGRVLFNDGAGEFGDSGQQLFGGSSSSVALGDMDGDGDLDALLGTAQGGVIWLNQGGGVFAREPGRLGSGHATAVFLRDLNGDGSTDALVSWKNKAEMWWNDGLSAYYKADQSFSFTARHAVTVGDFDGDGLLDVFAAAYGEDYKVWHNLGGGVYELWVDK